MRIMFFVAFTLLLALVRGASYPQAVPKGYPLDSHQQYNTSQGIETTRVTCPRPPRPDYNEDPECCYRQQEVEEPVFPSFWEDGCNTRWFADPCATRPAQCYYNDYNCYNPPYNYGCCYEQDCWNPCGEQWYYNPCTPQRCNCQGSCGGKCGCRCCNPQRRQS